ncbi:hypothetical protein BG004_008418 [Podila humilis]|nr:hypothetical protein BG004_008418 [Podila humilis]
MAVALKKGCGCEFLISLGLTLLGHVPGIVYAWWIIYQHRIELQHPNPSHRGLLHRDSSDNVRVVSRSYQAVGSTTPPSSGTVVTTVTPGGGPPSSNTSEHVTTTQGTPQTTTTSRQEGNRIIYTTTTTTPVRTTTTRTTSSQQNQVTQDKN